MVILGRRIQFLWSWRWLWCRWEFPRYETAAKREYGRIFTGWCLGPLEVRVWRKGHGRGH